MEYLRNLPSKTNAFSAANYERVRMNGQGESKPFFTTVDQTPHQVLPSSDENLILAAIRHKKQVPTINAEETPKRAPTPETGAGAGAGAGAGTGLDVQSTPQPPRLFKRPRIALSNAAAAAATTTTPTSVQSSVSSSSRPSA